MGDERSPVERLLARARARASFCLVKVLPQISIQLTRHKTRFLFLTGHRLARSKNSGALGQWRESEQEKDWRGTIASRNHPHQRKLHNSRAGFHQLVTHDASGCPARFTRAGDTHRTAFREVGGPTAKPAALVFAQRIRRDRPTTPGWRRQQHVDIPVRRPCACRARERRFLFFRGEHV